jgi:flagellin-like protein
MFQDDLNIETKHRAVSPVIGVILMVAITVILAAVIGAFVLEIGDQQETAPSTSFDTQEGSVFVQTNPPQDTWGNTYNLTRVSLTVAGGDNLDISQTQISLAGNQSVWAREGGRTASGPGGTHYGPWDGAQQMEPQPNVCETLGTNQAVKWSSGETNYVLAAGGEHINLKKGAKPKIPADTRLRGGMVSADGSVRPACDWQGINIDYPENEWYLLLDTNGNKIGQYSFGKVPMSGDRVSVVWQASSGGKSQRLQSYTVQSDSPDCDPVCGS